MADEPEVIDEDDLSNFVNDYVRLTSEYNATQEELDDIDSYTSVTPEDITTSVTVPSDVYDGLVIDNSQNTAVPEPDDVELPEDPIDTVSYITEYRTMRYALDRYDIEFLEYLHNDGATFYAILDDDTEVEINYNDIIPPYGERLEEVVRYDDIISETIGMNFWNDTNGVHVSQVEKDDWLQAVTDNFSDSSLDKPYHNILMNSEGILLRRALLNLFGISRLAISFYDGTGNTSNNITATFGSAMAQIGKTNSNHVVITSNGVTAYKGDGTLDELTAIVDGANLKNSTITGSKIASSAIENSNIKDGTITGAKIQDSAITGSKIASSTIENSNIKDGTITGAKIQGSTLTDIPYAEIDQLKTRNVTADAIQAATGFVSSLAANSITAAKLVADQGVIDNLETNFAHIQNGVIDNANINVANVNGLSANYAHITNGTIDNAKIGHADVNGLSANYASVGALSAETARVDTLVANTADLATIRANSAKVTNLTAAQLEADHATVGSLDTNYAQIDMANVNNAWITNGTIKDAAISDGMINSVSANKLTAGTIDASNITVTNLNADNITTGTINGQRIGAGSLSLDKLSEDVYTETEVDSIVSNLQTQIDGAIETWTGTAIPTLQNAPASSWTTNSIKDTHVGDVYFIVNSQSNQNGYNYRFTKSGTGNNITYSWQLIKDSDVTNALQRLTTAEGKITTFDSDISQLKTDTGTLTTKTTSLETRMGNAENDILDKVDTTTFNAVSDTVDSHSQTITQMSNTLSNKADSSTVSSLTTRVSKNEQDISGINSTIGSLETTVETKADGSTVETINSKVNTISDTVDGHTQNISSIVSTQTQINYELDKTIVETIRLYTIRSSNDIPSLPTTPILSGTGSSDSYLDNTGNALLDSSNNPIGSDVWSITKSSYNSSKPNYFYCYQHKHVDGSYTWSNVVRDNATTESQNLGHVTSENLTTVTTRVNNISDTVDGHTSQLSATTTSLTTLRTEFDNLEIGGRNLLYDTSDWSKWAKTANATASGDVLTCTNTDTSSGFQRANGWFIPAKADVMDREIVVSFDVKKTDATELSTLAFQMFTTSDTPKSVTSGDINEGTRFFRILDGASTGYFIIENTDNINATTWTRVSLRFVPSVVFNTTDYTEQAYLAVYIGIRNKIGSAQFRRIKAEYGNRATDWTPAPEDLEDYADNAANAVPRMAKINMAQRTFTTAQWKTYGAYGHTENWNTGSSYDNSHLRIGDRAYLTGTISDQMLGSATIIGKIIDVLPSGSGTSSVRMQSEQLIFGGDAVSAIQTSLSETQTDYATFKQTTQNFESTIGTTYATKTELNAIDDKIDNVDAAVLEIESRVTNAETSITQTNNQIALKANASDVYTKTQTDGLISTEVSNRNSAINQKADAITASVASTYTTKTDFNNLEIGGRNLLPYSEMKEYYGGIIRNAGQYYSIADDEIVATSQPTGGPLPGWRINNGTYIVSGTTSLSSIIVYVQGYDSSNQTVGRQRGKTTTVNSDGYFEFTIDDLILEGVLYFFIGIGSTNVSDYTVKPKLEKGNRATDWSPAPEDLEAYTDTQVNAAKAAIKVTTDNITSEVSKISSAKYVTSATASWSLPNIKTWAAEGHSETWSITSSANLRVGDTVYIKGNDSTRNCPVYIKVTVTGITSNASITGISHGYEDVLPVDTIKSTINQSSDSVKIQAKHVEIDGAAIFSNSNFRAAADAAYDTKGSAATVQTNLDNLEIGGRNLLKGRSAINSQMICGLTVDYDPVTHWMHIYGTNTKTDDSYSVAMFSGAVTQELVIGENYTLTIYSDDYKTVKEHVYVQCNYIRENGAQNSMLYIGNNVYQSTTRPCPSDYTYHDAFLLTFVGIRPTARTIDVTFRLKLEKGNKPTDWTPAPEDVDSAIGTAKTEAINAIPTDISELNNDTGFITNASLPTKVSDLTNDSGFQTSTQVNTAITSKGYQTSSQVESAITSKGYATTSQVNTAKTEAINSANSSTDTKLQSYSTTTQMNSAIGTAKTEAINAGYANYGYKYHKDIVIYGDSDKYYPVYFGNNGNGIDYSQNVPNDLLIQRGYNEQAPSDWNSSTHKGSLTLRVRWNYGGWGGATYNVQVCEWSEMYCTIVGDILVGNKSGLNSTIYLRGGGTTGALYHLYSDIALDTTVYGATLPYIGTTTPGTVYMQSGTYTWTVDNPLTTPNKTHILSLAAVTEEQYIYISKPSGINSVASTDTWVTANSDSQNTWTTKRPTYNSSYPVLFVAKQKKTATGHVICTTPVKDDTTTIIDGGHITTGTIDASRVTVTNINASNITTGSLSADRIKANVIDAVNNGTGTINADKINASALSIGYSQLSGTPTIPTKVSQLSNDSDFVNTDQLSTVIDGQNSVNDRVDESIVNTKILYTTRDVSTLPDAPNTPIILDSNISGVYLDSSSNSLLDSNGHTIVSKTWTVSRPYYSQEEPYYFYCYQYEHADGSYTWSNVMRDDATNESFKVLSSRVEIVCSSINYDNSTASLLAKLYVNNAETSGNHYQWFRDGAILTNQTNQTLTVTASMGINHLYSCTVDY